MPVPQELLNKIFIDEKRGNSSDNIVQAIANGNSYPEINAKVKQDLVNGHSANDILSAIKGNAAVEQPQDNAMSRAYTGFKAGLTEPMVGIGQRLGLIDQNTVDQMKEFINEDTQGTAGKVGKFAGGVAPYLVIPGVSEAGLAGRIGLQALIGGVSGAAQPTNENESAVSNATIGALLGGVGSATSEGLTGLVGKGINAFKGSVGNATTELGDKYGIRTTLGEATDNPNWKRTETWLEQVPGFGLKKFRESQQEEAKKAANDFLSKYIADPLAHDPMTSNRKFTGSFFQSRDSLLYQVKDKIIKPNETTSSAKELLDRYPDLFKQFQDTKTQNLLNNIVSDTKDATKISPLVDIFGNPIASTVPAKVTFEDMWALRDGIGTKIGQAKKQLASGQIDETQLGIMKKLYASVNKDIENWTNSIKRPDVQYSIKKANDMYKNYVVKFDAIQRVMENKKVFDTDGFLSTQKFSNALQEISKKNKYTQKFTENEINEMSGLANIMSIVKRAGQYKENPPTANRWGVPLIGAEIAGYLAQGTTGSVVAAGGVVGLAGLAKVLTGTDIGKRFVMSASNVSAVSPTMQRILNGIDRTLPRMLSVYASQSTGIKQKFSKPKEEIPTSEPEPKTQSYGGWGQ
jgi:hypothetical protein